MRKLTNKKIAAVAAGAVILTGTGVAYAYWTTTGTGSGDASVAASNGTLVLHSDDIDDITPGSSYDFDIEADNAGTTDLRVLTVSTVVSSSDAECQALIDAGTSGLSVADEDTDVNVPAGTDNVVIGEGTLVFANSAVNNQDDCKSAPLTLTFNPVAP